MEPAEQTALLYVFMASLQALARKADVLAAGLGQPLFGHFESDYAPEEAASRQG